MKKLLISSTDLMMIQFLVPHVRYLSENGFHVEIACSEVGGRMEDVRRAVDGYAKAVHTVRLVRSPVSTTNFKGYGDMKRLLSENRYDIIWTNEPVMGVVTRLAARKLRKQGTKVVYMVHGFHFYKGSSKSSWLLYYPVEKFMRYFTDVLVTINHEDEARAARMGFADIRHINGIGVDYSKIDCKVDRAAKRSELGVAEDEVLLLSVGELQTRKNHEVIIRALAQLNDPKVKYYICGRGELLEYLQRLTASLGLQNNVMFLGYRKDVPQIMKAADIYAHPSKREGLGLASLEAMACGLPLVTSNVQGIPDYVENGVTGFMCDPDDTTQYARHISILISNPELRNKICQTNLVHAKVYAIEQIQPVILDILNQR